MPFEVPVIRDGYTRITQSNPPMWQFYNAADDTYSAARPVACWRDAQGPWIEAETNVSRTTGRQYRLVALWDETHQEWLVKHRTPMKN